MAVPPFTKVSLDSEAEDFGARCLDGSVPAFYIRPSAVGSDNWVIRFEGGGSCKRDVKHPCIERIDTDEGSSARWPHEMEVESNLFVLDKKKNPLFYDFNHIYIRNCDGISFMGSNKHPVESLGQKIWYSGANTVKAVIHRLKVAYGAGNKIGSQMIVVGTSSGTLAAFTHADTFLQSFPKSMVTCIVDSGTNRPRYCPVKKNAKAVSVGVGSDGFRTNNQDYRYNTGNDLAIMRKDMLRDVVVRNSGMTTDGMHQGCIAAHPNDPNRCTWPLYIFPYQRTPTFTLQSLYDVRDIRGGMACSGDYNMTYISQKEFHSKIITQYGQDIKESIRAAIKLGEKDRHSAVNTEDPRFISIPPVHGGFYDTCYRHVERMQVVQPDHKTGTFALQEVMEHDFWNRISTKDSTATTADVPNVHPISHTTAERRGRFHRDLTMEEAFEVWYFEILKIYMKQVYKVEIYKSAQTDCANLLGPDRAKCEAPFVQEEVTEAEVAQSVRTLEAFYEDRIEKWEQELDKFYDDGEQFGAVTGKHWYAKAEPFYCNDCCHDAEL